MSKRYFVRAEDERRKRARVLTLSEVRRVFDAAKDTKFPLENTMMVALSFYAGLRSCEIAKLETNDQLDAAGIFTGNLLHVSRRVAKYGAERDIPMWPVFKEMLRHFLSVTGRTDGPILRDRWGKQMSSHTVQERFRVLFRRTHLENASSHSGRRMLITLLCRHMSKTNCPLDEIRRVAGHASVDMTMIYIEPSEHGDELLINPSDDDEDNS